MTLTTSEPQEVKGAPNVVAQRLKTIATVMGVLVAVVILSALSVRIQNPGKEGGQIGALTMQDTMTVALFAQVNGIPNPVLKKALGLTGKSELNKRLNQLGMPLEEIRTRVSRQLRVKVEYESRNWIKIPLKFMLWTVVLVAAFVVMRRRGMGLRARVIFYALSVAIFGIVLGSDPNPMGTVKDAVVLFGKERVVFPPRMVALSVFLLMVVVANKFICSWGCQFGTLQDLLHRIGRRKDGVGAFPRYKIPFVVSNTIRLLTLVTLTAAAFVWSFDAISLIDPFRIFSPGNLGIVGALFVAAVALLSMVVYRPWCHLFCPFGFVGWIVEKASIFKIRVNYDTCISCGKCAHSCPSTVMSAILLRNTRTIPDCFSCGTCIEVCPTRSVSFSRGKRARPH